ncbi:MAG: ribosome recycling factor [Desulfomonilia bacterium]|jgi:ribosome recycling factor|uniref:Ribosome recycling factor n=1 Tax=anaerobic digester metagenome TaxID=1263854 RepID=A0A485M4P2_9ZZZZ|nr:ribosome recycling factor [Pseudomonadota bacterium]HON37266.1 ribosome recycling factor [Deltaproteobacteria bacterium]HRS56635.1 ribosome recycling factor [Desulfomonilia bacterium]HPD21826.1 ribosome recycling factor [Deltaproteobacteria bacterium]HPX18654.1 ribosome recycling factor [Deltaproteobacteria bacterium]
MMNEVIDGMKQDMEKTVAAMKQSLQKVRTGRASIGILDGIMVDYYGTPTPLKQLATLAVPEPRLITIQPWDKGAISSIEKAIFKSELGLTPANDGKIIRVPIPPLNEERRRDLVKMVKKMAEEYRVEIRNHRRDANAMLKDLEKDKEISQDELKTSQDKVQDLTNDYIRQVDAMLADKEKEIMEV